MRRRARRRPQRPTPQPRRSGSGPRPTPVAGCLRRRRARHPHDPGPGRRTGPRRPLRRRCHRPVAELRPEAHHRRTPDLRRRRRSRPTRSSRRARSCGSTSRSRRARPRSPRRTSRSTIVYEDDDLLIVDKPAGLVVHPVAGHHDGDTLVNALLARAGGAEYGGIAGVARPGIVHRLDRDTSGLLMVAKHDKAQASLMAQLKARRVRKTYLALVQGSVVGGGRADRGADRPRPEAPDPDGGRPGRPAVHDRLPRPRAVRTAGPCSSSISSPAGPTRSASTSTRSAIPIAGDPVYGTGTSRRGPGRPRPAVPARLAARARLAVRRAPHPGRGAAPRRAGAGDRRRSRARARPTDDRARRRRDATRRAGPRLGRPGPSGLRHRRRARGAAGDHLGPVGRRARTRSSTRSARAPTHDPDVPLRRHRARPARRGRARSTASTTTS